MPRHTEQLESVTGVQLARGIAVPEAKGFWAEAWGQVLRRPSALAAMVWLGVIGFFAVFAPVVASGHPLVMRATDRATGVVETTFPLLEHLRTSDRLLLMGVPLGLLWVLLPVGGTARIAKLGACIYGGALSILMVVAGGIVHSQTGHRDPSPFTGASARRCTPRCWLGAARRAGSSARRRHPWSFRLSRTRWRCS